MSSGGKSRQRSSQESRSFLAPFQEPFLQSLQGQALAEATANRAPAGAAASGLVFGDLLPQARQFLGGLQETAAGRFGQGLAGTIGQLQELGSIDRIEQALTQPNPALGGQLDALSSAIQDNLRTSTELIAGEAGLAGQRGGSRQALATGLAAGEAQEAFGRGASQLLAQDFAQRQALAPQLLQQRLGALSEAGRLGTAAAGLQTQAAGAGLAGAGQALALGQAPFTAGLAPLLAAAGIIQPIVLSEGQAEGSTDTFNFGFNDPLTSALL